MSDDAKTLRAALENAVSGVAGFVQARYHKRSSTSVAVENGILRPISSGVTEGVGIRVLRDGVWGFCSTSRLDRNSLSGAAREAWEAAGAGRGMRKSFGDPSVNPARGTFLVRETRPVSGIGMEEKVEFSMRMEKALRARDRRITSASVGYREMVDEKVIVTSFGSRAMIRDVKLDFHVSAIASDGVSMERGSVSMGATGGWGELFRHQEAEKIADQAARSAVEKLGAPAPEAGIQTVILHPTLVGILAHEAIGHTVEADFVLSGNVVSGRVGQRVAAECVTLVDDPCPPEDSGAAGVLLVDDEGNLPRRAVIIENGILTGYLHDSETASLFGVANTGNARAYTYRDEPIVRMRNTYVLPGAWPLEEMVSSVKKGFYLKDLGMSGQADANAEFMFDVGEAWKIENGRLGGRVKGVTISGQAFEVLSSVDMVGDDLLIHTGGGACGKHQPAKVDGGGPHIRCRIKIGGRL